MGLIELQQQKVLKMYETLAVYALNAVVGALGAYALHKDYFVPANEFEELVSVTFVVSLTFSLAVLLGAANIGPRNASLRRGGRQLHADRISSWGLLTFQLIISFTMYSEPLYYSLRPAFAFGLVLMMGAGYRMWDLVANSRES